MKGRPAESTTAVAAVGALTAYVHGVRDPQTLATITAGIGLLPAAISLVVDAGGLRGVLRKLWRGRSGPS
jgi:hypothetical protein